MSKTFRIQGAQGDVLLFDAFSFTATDAIPPGAVERPPVGGVHVVAHSETGHHHVIDEAPGVRFFSTSDPLTCHLRIEGGTESPGAALRHLRPWDTHETVLIPPGAWVVRYGREYVPEGQRQVLD